MMISRLAENVSSRQFAKPSVWLAGGVCSQACVEELAYAYTRSVGLVTDWFALRDLPPRTMTAPTARLTRRLFKNQLNSFVPGGALREAIG